MGSSMLSYNVVDANVGELAISPAFPAAVDSVQHTLILIMLLFRSPQ
jgi:hypothetical protein